MTATAVRVLFAVFLFLLVVPLFLPEKDERG